MQLTKLLLIALTIAQTTGVTAQTVVAHYDMSLNNGKITEQVTKSEYAVMSQLPACTLAGIDGQALRFDGYSNYVHAGNCDITAYSDFVTCSVIFPLLSDIS